MAFQKVMISGVNTSELTVLQEKEKMELLREIKETGSKEARQFFPDIDGFFKLCKAYCKISRKVL